MTKGSSEEGAGLQPLNPWGSAPAGKKDGAAQKVNAAPNQHKNKQGGSWLTFNEQTIV